MKKNKRDQMDNMDEFEDLTLFANESFDTQGVDLFEFTSEESSTLTRLKSIILSLDWEISDEILQELADELADLGSIYTGDTVAEIYLQGLGKIGSYIRTKGAYAHPNAIKLLLTFFYDFEKTVSSPDITAEEITRIFKGDIRKFKILQYQIALGEEDPAEGPTAATTAETPGEGEPGGDDRRLLKAAILSLDWEVTEESLAQYTDSLAAFRAQVADNRLALVLVHGLQVLGEYIGDERADAHPETFALLHSFAEAVEQLVGGDETGLNDTGAREIITEQVNRLNGLKLLIAAPGETVIDEARIDEVVDEISAPAAAADIIEEPFVGMAEPEADRSEALNTVFPIDFGPESGAGEPAGQDWDTELDGLFTTASMPAMESADLQYPDEILPPEAIHPLDNELADDLIEASLPAKRGLTPALSGAEESGRDQDIRAEDNFAKQLDVLFAEADSRSDQVAAQQPAADDAIMDLDFAVDAGATVGLAGTEESADHVDLELKTPPAELNLEAALDSFFTRPGKEQPDFDLEAALQPENFDLEGTLDSLFAEPVQAESHRLGSLPEAAGEDIIPRFATGIAQAVLSDIEQPDSFDALGLEGVTSESDLEDIESQLDSFFAETVEEREQRATPTTSVREIEQSLFFADQQPVRAALADADGERGFSEEVEMASLAFTPLDDIEKKLDLFFGKEEQFEAVEATPWEALLADLPIDTAGAPETSGPNTAYGKTADHDLGHQLDFFGVANDDDEVQPQEAAEDELTRALEATIAAEEATAPPSGLGLAAALTPSTAEREPVLASLGALLPGVVRSPTRTREKVKAALEQTATLSDLTEEVGQRALVQLLGAVVTLLERTASQDDAATSALVNFLYAALLRGDGGAKTLAEAIGRYAGWQEGVCSRLPRIPAQREKDEVEPQLEYTARDLYFELSELRAGFRDEFARLRHEVQHLQQHRHH